MESNTFY